MLLTLKPNEQIIKIFRHARIIHWWHYLFIFILLVAPFFFMFLLFSWGNWGVALFAASLSLGLYLLFRAAYFRYGNALVLTNERVVAVERRGLLHKTALELGHDNIVNVSYKIKGFFPTIFCYGRVKIQTARGGADLEFDFLTKPHAVSELLNSARGNFIHAKYQTGGKDLVSSIIEKMDFLSRKELGILEDALAQKLGENGDEDSIA